MATEPTLDASALDSKVVDALAPGATALDQSEESSTQALYRAAIGPVGAAHYLPIFAKFEAADRGSIGWNWVAALFTLNWMAFRQLWSAALAYCGAVVGGALLIFGIGRLVFQFSETVQTVLLATFGTLMVLVPGLWGNAMFHADCRQKMAKALAANTTLPEACAMLARQASTRKRLLWLGALNLTLAGLATLAYLKFPAAGTVPYDPPRPTNVATGRTTEPAKAVSAPVSAISAPLPVASAPAVASSAPTVASSAPAPLPAPIASAPVLKSSAPAQAIPAKPAASAVASIIPSITPPVARPPVPPKAAASAAISPAVSPAINTTAALAPGFYINVGLFANDDNASKAQVKLKEADLPVFTQIVKGPKGRFTRVRVGPFDSQANADAASTKIQALGLDAVVFTP